MLNKLNGWQRLWVVVSIALLIVLALLIYTRILHVSYVVPFECKEIANRIIKEKEKSDPLGLFRDEKEYQTLQSAGFSKAEIDDYYFHRDPEYKACADKAERNRWLTFFIKVFLVWLATIAFIYGAGFSVAWVRGGFRHKNE